MMAFCPQIKLLHLWLVGLSGGLFAVRGLCALLDMRWPRWDWVKWSCLVIDSLHRPHAPAVGLAGICAGLSRQ